MIDQEVSFGILTLEDGTEFRGISFGANNPQAGEVVFNTGLVGYTESLTDPSYKGQILVLTYPLIGNYGVPGGTLGGVARLFESSRLQISGFIVSNISREYSHWNATHSLPYWLKMNQVPALSGIDTRKLTKILREKGTMLGQISFEGASVEKYDPNQENLAAKVSCRDVRKYDSGTKRVVLIDCGCKNSIINSLLDRNVTVIRVPWNYDFTQIEHDGVLVSNGPGDPKYCTETIENLKRAFETKKPIFGICLGNQLLSLAAGADTYKLKYGHRSQNQPCVEEGTKRCFITSQNHGFAVKLESLKDSWVPWFKNANDGTVEGVRHKELKFSGVQFHPEARPGPTDTRYLFDQFVSLL